MGTLRVALLLCCAATLAGCGFQLRGLGGEALPREWQQLAFASANPNSEFSREFRSRFSARGVDWVAPETANYVVRLGPERFSQRNLSLNAQARAAEFELNMSTTFSVVDRQGELLIGPSEASVLKQMENDPGNVVGKTEEIRILRQEMRAELARQIIRRITFFATGA